MHSGILGPNTLTKFQLLPQLEGDAGFSGGAFIPEGPMREMFRLERTLVEGMITIPDPGTVDSATMWFGACIISEAAFASAAVFPIPGDPNAMCCWLFLGCRTVRHRSAVTSGFDPASLARVEFEINARRIFHTGDERLAVIFRNDDDSLGNIQSDFCIRTLWSWVR